MTDVTFTKIDPTDQTPASITFSRVTPPSFLQGVGTGLADKFYAGAQIGAHMPMTPPDQPGLVVEFPKETVETVDKAVKEREQALEKEGYNKGWGRAVGNILGDIGLTAPLGIASPEAMAASTLGRIGVGAVEGGIGGAVSGAMQPVANGDFATAKKGQIEGGAIGGGALGAVAAPLSHAIMTDDAEKAEQFIKEMYTRYVKPSVKGKGSASQLETYLDRARDAISSIVKNKENLNFTDEAGNAISGQLPRSLDQFGQAIEQTKSKIFNTYNTLTKEAGATGVEIGLLPATNELETLASDKALQLANPGVAKYAQEVADRYAKSLFLTPEETQNTIKYLNDSLKEWYHKKDYGRAMVDALAANNLRKGLDAAVSSITGEAYQPLKNAYGALREIEKEVVNRAVVSGRQNQGGGLMGIFGNLVSAEQVARGVVMMEPSHLAIGAAVRGTTEFMRYLHSPNRAVTRMFQTAERAEKGASIPRRAASSVQPYVAPAAGAMGGASTADLMGYMQP